MRGVQWDSGSRLRCGDCGGYEIDLLEDGRARCRACGRVSTPTRVSRVAGLGRAMLLIFGLFLVLLAVEAAAAWLYASVSGASFLRTYSLAAFVTGFAAIVLAGVGASPGRVAMGSQRQDRLGRMFPIQDPVAVGTMSAEAKARRSDEPGAAGTILLALLGTVLVLVGFAFGVV